MQRYDKYLLDNEEEAVAGHKISLEMTIKQ
jgi:hypothetical protein